MGLAVWFFVRRHERDFRPASVRAMEAFLGGERPLPEASPRGYLEFAEVQVALSGRRATDLFPVGYCKYKPDSRGMVDREEQNRRVPVARADWRPRRRLWQDAEHSGPFGRERPRRGQR